MRDVWLRLGLIALALAFSLLPISEDVVESVYATGVYPRLQVVMTSVSNQVPVALFDLLVLAVIALWTARLVGDWRRQPRRVALIRVLLRTATIAAAMYLGFLLAWGFNYRRVPLEAKLQMRYADVNAEGAERVAVAAVDALNRLHADTQPSPVTVNVSLPPAFADVQRRVGLSGGTVPGRPKRTLLDPYFRAASIDGMTDPFFLETLLLSTLLPIEQPMIVAHEWAHLAGFADEGEANFIGWLTCMHGDAAAQYSAWLFLYFEVTPALSAEAGKAVAGRLLPGPREDLAAIARRVQAQRSPVVAQLGWGVYDQYLKANGVERGTQSYTDVIRFVLGTSLGTAELARVTRAAAPAAPWSAAPAPAPR